MPTDAPEVLQREDAVEEHEDDAASDPDVCIESVKKVRAIVADHADFVGLWQTSLVGVFSCYDDMVAEMESIITDRFLPNVEMRKALLAVAESAAHLGEVTDKSDPEEAILGVIAQASPSMTAAPSSYVQVCISMVAALSGIPQDKKMILPESGPDIQALTLDAETSDDAPDDALTVKRSCIVEFPQHVVASTFATESVDFLQKCAAQLMGQFMEHIKVKCIILPNTAAVDAARGNGLARLAACVIDGAVVTQHAALEEATLDNVLTNMSKPTACKSLLRVLLDIAPLVDVSSLVVAAMQEHMSATKVTDDAVDILRFAFGAYAELQHIARSIASYAPLTANSGYACGDTGAKDSVTQIIIGLRKMCASAKELLEQVPPALLKLGFPGPVVTPELGSNWLKVVSEKVVPEMAEHCIKDVASILDRHSSELRSKLPNFEHIFPEGLYIRNLAASELLHAPHRAALPKHSVQLFHFIGSLARVHTALHLSPPAVSHPLTKATIAAAQVVYDRAKLIVSIIAHAHVIQVETGAQQKLSAAALLKRADPVPQVLLQARAGALADILDKSLPTPRLRKLANPPAGRLPPMPDRRPPDRRPPARPPTRQRVPGRRPASPMPAHARHARSDGRACMPPPACSCFWGAARVAKMSASAPAEPQELRNIIGPTAGDEGDEATPAKRSKRPRVT